MATTVNVDSSAGDVTLAAAPASNQLVRLIGLVLTADDSMKVVVKSGSTVKATFYLDVGNEVNVLEPETGIVDAANGEAMTLTITGSGNCGGVAKIALYGRLV